MVNENETIPSNEVQPISTINSIPKYQTHEQNLEFCMIQCSSNQGVFSPFKLSINNIDSKYKTWISSKHCEYPQYITLQLMNGICQINTLQILFHQHYIPSKVELFLGKYVKMPSFDEKTKPLDYENLYKSFVAVEFEKIGYFTLFNNQQANNTARELKSVMINKQAQYIKLVIYDCYENELNKYNQVGIISVRVKGIPLEIEDLSNKNNSSNHKKYKNFTPRPKDTPSKNQTSINKDDNDNNIKR
ncbi:hypothetical protein LY90DRAFT_663181 [Neocallimastix californiae]|uniref:Centrosomal protein CEP104 N-terminal domain-containing protein n=1 Tax=Neocallimastix californiae TaxID=1754190 RepID=A0A1Y2FRA2_9FUNG|nr:hypothetical protein LY90DRAFT_663181 [Neocallimastix californiae]|eukprot:ORY86530.1 hypothetical protein LY90DRAFT_663181 [Neocallimastix californiae]